jgi:hypothetical protein
LKIYVKFFYLGTSKRNLILFNVLIITFSCATGPVERPKMGMKTCDLDCVEILPT